MAPEGGPREATRASAFKRPGAPADEEGMARVAERRLSAERIATLLFPHRASILTAGLAAFLAGVLPLAAVARGDASLAAWHVGCFAASVPLVLWSLGLVCLACFFHPAQGLVRRNGDRRRWLRGYATLTCWAFAAAPLAVLLAAAR